MKSPKKLTVRLGPARRMYIRRLLERGLSGDTPGEVLETIVNRGLQEIVPPEWMRDAIELAQIRARRKR